MNRKARRWAAAAALILLVAGGALAFGQLSGTFAIFNAETENQNAVFNGSWIPAPSGGTSSLNGSPYATEHLAWASGHSAATPSPNPVTGQTIYYADGGTGASASCGTYGAFSTTTAAATTADVTGTNLSHWWCFEVYSTSAAATTSGTWTSGVTTFSAVRIFVVTAFDQHNVTTTNTARNGDQIVLTFNQNRGAWNGGNGAALVRFCNTGKILISTSATTCATTAPNLGTITGQTVATSMTCNTSTTAGNGTTTLTITLAGCSSTSNIGAGTATFTPTGTALAASAGTNLCASTSAPACTATTTDRF